MLPDCYIVLSLEVHYKIFLFTVPIVNLSVIVLFLFMSYSERGEKNPSLKKAHSKKEPILLLNTITMQLVFCTFHYRFLENESTKCYCLKALKYIWKKLYTRNCINFLTFMILIWINFHFRLI